MKNRILLLLLLCPLAVLAQNNDMFYVPKRPAKQKEVTKVVSTTEEEWGIADNGNNRDVDEYNRRGQSRATNESTAAESVQYVEEYESGDDYQYTTRVVRFHNPTIVVNAPGYWNCYPAGWWYDSYWGLSYNNFYWGSSLYWPHYTSYWPSYAPHWHYAPAPPIHGIAARPASVRDRIPVASVRPGSQGNKRVPVAQSGGTGNRVPSRATATESRKPVASKVDATNSRSNVKKTSSDDAGSASKRSSSSYSRPSSTSVRRQGTSNAPRRAPASGGSQRSSGASRGGRR